MIHSTDNGSVGAGGATVTIRRLNEADGEALRRLAQREGGEAPELPALGAEVEGRLLAAISLADGIVVADPFARTEELRPLLRLRASQLGALAAPRRRRFAWRRPQPRPALGGHPAGTGRVLLETQGTLRPY